MTHLSSDLSSGESSPRRSLILAGGGIRVAYQAGVLRALEEEGLTFFHADGTSGGTMNLAMLLSGLSPIEMAQRWRSLDVKDFVSMLPLADYLNPFTMAAMGDADGIIDGVFPHLGIDIGAIRSATGIAGTFNVCNYTRKTNEAIPHERIDRDLLVAGISLPIFMPPVRHANGDLYTDSVWIKDANLMEAVRRGAEELWLVWCIGNHGDFKGGAFNQYVHMIELSANGALFEEFDRIRELNERIERGDSPHGQRRPITLHVIRPEYPLPLDPALFLGRISADALIDMGYADAKQYLRGRTERGVPFQPEATRMSDTKPGITFRETMKGGFAMNETDPEEGARAGEENDTELAMHATIEIQDLDRFINDRDHPGRITGHVDFAPLGSDMPSTSGVFNLFSPADAPSTKYMVYELGFDAGGESYYMAGKKEVRDDPGFDFWKDVTTLYTRLHKGRDTSGPVVGAGVLSLSMGEFIKMLPGIHAMNTDTVAEEAKALARFGRFFMGELWDSYAPGKKSEV